MSKREASLAWIPIQLATFCFVALWTTAARGEDSEDTSPIVVNFSYTAPDECPKDERAFSLVHRRTERVVRGDEATATQDLKMEVARVARGYRGQLTVTRTGQSPERRAMAGKNCKEVVEALALTAALSIDPDATLTLGALNAEDEREGTDADGGKEDENGEPKRESRGNQGEPGRPEDGQSPDAISESQLLKPDATQARPTSGRRRRGFGVDSEPTRTGIGPIVSLARVMDTGVHLGAGVSLSLGRGEGTRWFPQETRFSLLALFDVSPSESPSIRTQLYLLRLAYCPVRFGRKWSFLVCPSGELGALSGKSRGVISEDSVTRVYASVGIEGWTRAQIHQDWDIWLSPELRVPLTRRQFGVDPGPLVIASTVDVGWGLTAGASWLF